MNIAHTRAMVRAAIDGRLGDVTMRVDPTFGVVVPTSCPDVPASFLDPRSTWADRAAYDRAAERLAGMFATNFLAYADGVEPGIVAAGPRVPEGWTPDPALLAGGPAAG
jgi:phosphoenolpyruvate carboxykinase (ATP)